MVTRSPQGDIANISRNIVTAQENTSKVVDENGEPMVVYHGTGTEFNEFNFSNWRKTSNTSGKAFYFTPDEKRARGFGKPIPAFLNVRNPFIGWGGLSENMKNTLRNKEGLWEDVLKETGFDGDLSNKNTPLAFSPNQIKSATGNVGTFSEQTNDIRFSIASNEKVRKIIPTRIANEMIFVMKAVAEVTNNCKQSQSLENK